MTDDEKFREFMNNFIGFCSRYSNSVLLRAPAQTVRQSYMEAYQLDGIAILNPQYNITAAKFLLDANPPRDLMRGLEMLFQKRGARLTGDFTIEHHIAVKTIMWLAKNIAHHIEALHVVIDAERLEKIANG